MTGLDDPGAVREEYETDERLARRIAAYRFAEGDDPREVLFGAVAEGAPRRVLEVGCGDGWFSERVRRELGCEVVAVDQSRHMVELTRSRGVEALVGDAAELPFEDGSFDCAVAAWMLYHVARLEQALAELARVLRAGGRLVATTNGFRHLAELWSLVGRDRARECLRFFAENGEESLRRHFARVERRDVVGPVTFADSAAVRGYIAASVAHKHLADRVPEFEGRLRATRVNTVFLAET